MGFHVMRSGKCKVVLRFPLLLVLLDIRYWDDGVGLLARGEEGKNSRLSQGFLEIGL